MYVYEHFMHLDGIQKTITHGATMIGMMTGAAFCSRFAKRLDKKKTVYVGGAITLASGIALTALFVPEFVKPEQVLSIGGFNFPVAMVLFALFGATYWFGNGVMIPVATSMMADISEINELKTGINKDGSYSAMYSLSMKISQSLSALIVGFVLAAVGFVTLSDVVGNEDYAVGFMEGSDMTFSSNAVLGFVSGTERVEGTDADWGFVKGTGTTIQVDNALLGFMPAAGVVQSNDTVLGYLTVAEIVPGDHTVAASLDATDLSRGDGPVSGYVKGASVTQSQGTVMKLFIATYIIGPVISITALILIWLYPVNREILEKLRADAA